MPTHPSKIRKPTGGTSKPPKSGGKMVGGQVIKKPGVPRKGKR